MDEIPSGSVIVTPDDMWKVVQETRDTVNDLKTLLTPKLTDMADDIEKLDAREQAHHDDHEKTIHELQKRAWSSSWVTAAATAALTGTVGAVILWLVGNGHIS